jgi:hypothetical protein
MSNESHSKSSLDAAAAALKAHEEALKIVGDPDVQLWHLLASLHEWSAVNGVDFDAELRNMQSELHAGELGLPAAEAAHRARSAAGDEPTRSFDVPGGRG